MTSSAKSLQEFLSRAPAALVEVVEALGSTPREKGAWMLVSADAIFGTIGGGQLEFIAIAKAREVLDASSDVKAHSSRLYDGEKRKGGNVSALLSPRGEGGEATVGPGEGEVVSLDIPLGPEIGQCCGGRVALSIRLVDGALRAELEAQARKQDEERRQVVIFGGGHVGHALAAALALLPVRAMVVETRAEALDGMPPEVETRLTPVPEEMVRQAPPGSAFVVLTHDHALDFLIVAEALKRDDAGYVGMIGSKTKKATFRNWFVKVAGGTDESYRRLVSPIGGAMVKDKRPAVIAALAAAEIITALANAKSPGSAAGSVRP